MDITRSSVATEPESEEAADEVSVVCTEYAETGDAVGKTDDW